MRPEDGSDAPVVSVVIPTRNRPVLLLRAVRSVLRQTLPALEVIVIIDGPDPATETALAEVVDARLQVLCNPTSSGPGPARNTAAAGARAPWVAFLDDDDEWLPEKLAQQLAGRDPAQNVVVSCRCQVNTPRGAHIWPRRLPLPGEPVDEYLFARRSFLRGESYIATPTLLMPTRLFNATRFGTTWQNEDTTLLLRATKGAGATLVMLPDVLAVIHAANPAQSLGTEFPWRQSLAWALQTRPALSPRALAGFCLVTLGSQAARMRDARAVPILLRTAVRKGRPNLVQLLLFLGFWVIPRDLRHRLRALLGRDRSGRAPC